MAEPLKSQSEIKRQENIISDLPSRPTVDKF